jgi:hypothetical protein
MESVEINNSLPPADPGEDPVVSEVPALSGSPPSHTSPSTNLGTSEQPDSSGRKVPSADLNERRMVPVDCRSFRDSVTGISIRRAIVLKDVQWGGRHNDLGRRVGLEVYRPEVRSSCAKVFHECPRKFMYEYRWGLKRKGDYFSALQIGIDTHEVLSELYAGVVVDKYPEWVARKVREQWDRLDTVVDEKTGLLPNGRSVVDVRETIRKDAVLAMALAKQLVTAYPPDRMLQKYDLLKIEEPYVLRIEGIPAPIAVELDMLLRHKETKELWVVDHKTTSLSPLMRAQTLPFEFQARLYQWVLKLARPNEKIGGYIHNIIQKPGIRVGKNETYDSYIEKRVPEWYAERFELHSDDPPIIQSLVPAPRHFCPEELLLQVLELAKACSSMTSWFRFPRREANCMGKFGNQPCPYLPLCRVENGHGGQFPPILEQYVQDPRELLAEKVSRIIRAN